MEHFEAAGFAVVYYNNREIGRWVPLETMVSAYMVDIRPGYPVFAVRGEWGLGAHWDTMLFAIRRNSLVMMGQPPAMNSNGPIVWHGLRNVWAFDNFDRYKAMDHSLRLSRVLMRVGTDGKLHRLKTIRTRHPRIPITIHTEDDLNIPAGGL